MGYMIRRHLAPRFFALNQAAVSESRITELIKCICVGRFELTEQSRAQSEPGRVGARQEGDPCRH